MSNIRDVTLLRSYLASALNLLESEAQKTPIPTVAQERFLFEGTSFGTEYVPVTLYRAFVRKRRGALNSLADAQGAGRALFDGSVYARAADINTSAFSLRDRDRFASELRDIFVASFLEHYQRFTARAEEFDEHLERFRSVWHSDRVEHVVTVPLLQFRASKSVNLERDLAIAPLTAEAKSQLWLPDIINPARVTPWEFATAEWAVIGKYDSASPMQPHYAPVMPKVHRAMLAMRLAKSGGVFAEIAYDTLKYEYLATLRTTTPQNELKVGRDIHDTYELFASEAPHLIDIYLMLGKEAVISQLKTVTDRFQQAYIRDRVEDRVVDLAVAMEAMLLHGVGSDKAHHLSLRGATLLSDVFERRYSSSLLKALYSARSKIVHAGATIWDISKKGGLISSFGPDRFLSEVEQWARAGIRRSAVRIASGESLVEIAKSLDQA